MLRFAIIALTSISMAIAGNAQVDQSMNLPSATESAENVHTLTSIDFAHEQRALFRKADTNFDSAVSREETIVHYNMKQTERLTEQFEKLDTDYNGYLTEDELSPMAGNRKASGPQVFVQFSKTFFEKYDQDKNGNVTEEEVAETMLKEAQQLQERFDDIVSNGFSQQDDNQDGTLSLQEYLQSHISLEIKAYERVFTRDKNGDGLITYSENEGFITELFNALDQDQDGELSVHEQSNTGYYEAQNIRVGTKGLVSVYSYEGLEGVINHQIQGGFGEVFGLARAKQNTAND